LSKDAPEDEDWAAVGRAVSERRDRLGISTAHLSRESGLSETTIRYIGSPSSNTKSTLVAMSAVLGWRYDHLTNVLHGQPQDTAEFTSPVDAYFEKLLSTEVRPVKQEVAGIVDLIHHLDQKIDVIIQAQSDHIERPGTPP